jgi:hypothetical protein
MERRMEQPKKSGRITDFGIFYPLGYMVVAFPEHEHATRVREDLLTGGYDSDDCVVYRSDEVVATASQNLAYNTGWLARLGTSDDAVRHHLESAKEGATFVLIYAPDDIEVARAMNVVRRVPFEFAHRYRRFAIEEMK